MTPPAARRLTRRSEIAILAICVAVFLVVNGPIWRHPLDPSLSIVWSYAPIPALVAIALLLERKLSVGAFLVETLLIAVLKFGVTALILIGALVLEPTPRAPVNAAAPLPRARRPRRPVPTRPEPSVIAEDARGELAGVVTDGGRPAPGAVVYVSRGLERWAFAPAPGSASLTVRGSFSPPVLAISAWQPLSIVSGDGRLHTLDVRTSERTLMNLPVLPGAARTVTIAEPAGTCTLRCDVHPEEKGTLVVLPHPFFTVADAAGRFTLPRVPAADVEVTALLPARTPAAVRVTVPARARADVALAIR